MKVTIVGLVASVLVSGCADWNLSLRFIPFAPEQEELQEVHISDEEPMQPYLEIPIWEEEE